MPRVKISDLGQHGIYNDLPRWSIPANALSDGQNVRAFHGRLKNFGGRQKVADTPTGFAPYGLYALQTPNRATLWIEAGLTQVYAYDGNNHTEITRLAGPYTMNEYADRWTGGTQANIAFLNNGADGPQIWAPIDTATRLVDMNYDPQAAAGSQTWDELGYTAYAMRPFKNTIIAMNLRKGITSLTNNVAWCEFLAPGDTNTDWVPRTTNNAGEQTLGDTTGNIIDGAKLRDDFIIYKEDAVYRCSFTNDSRVFRFTRLPEHVRIINRNCIGVADEFHVVASKDDVQVFDGNTFTSILEHKMREFYKTRMFSERIQTTYVSVFSREDEVWICFPSQDAAGTIKSPDLALVWNYHDNTMSLTDIPEVRAMAQGPIVTPINDRFDDTEPSDLSFDEDTLRFDETPFDEALDFMVGAHGETLSQFGEVPTDDGVPRQCLAERVGLILVDEKSGMESIDAVHTLREVRPHLQSTGYVQIRIGAQESPGSGVQWEPEINYNPITETRIKTRATGRLFAYQLSSNANVEWDLTDMEFEYVLRRRR